MGKFLTCAERIGFIGYILSLCLSLSFSLSFSLLGSQFVMVYCDVVNVQPRLISQIIK